MEKFFSIFGKVVLVAAILGGAAYTAFYYGQKTAAPQPITSTEVPAPSATPTPTEATPAATPAGGTTITAGLGASSGLLFTEYTITIPAGWTYTHDKDTSVPTDTVTITKGTYMIKIFQAATGGALCLYPGDPVFEGPSSSYDTFVAITTQDGTAIRRSGTTAASGTTRGFTGCQKSLDGSYQQPTIYGHMAITTPLTPAAATLSEIDAMIASLKKT